MGRILTDDQKGLLLFEDGIKINYKLQKWVNAEKRIKARKEASKECNCKEVSYYSLNNSGSAYIPTTQNVTDLEGTSSQVRVFVTPVESDGIKLNQNLVLFDKVASANLFELTEIIKENGEIMRAINGYDNPWSMAINNSGSGQSKIRETFFDKLRNWILKKREEMSVEFDAVDFFTQVKLTTKESAETYRDRVANYIKAIHNAHAIGQTALTEKLLSEMIANKYENLLDAEGLYYAVTEEQIADFVKKTERGVELCYISNFGRPIPEDVNEKIAKVNDLEVFDNYVVMYYDPKGEIKKETQQEKHKRKDPILFGIIAGSKKLYYIADWVDDYCDLTLEKFVDTLKIDKEDLRMIKEDKKEVKKEAKKEDKKEVKNDEEEKPKKTAKKTKK